MSSLTVRLPCIFKCYLYKSVANNLSQNLLHLDKVKLSALIVNSCPHTQLIPVEALVCQTSGLELTEAVLEEGEGTAVEVILCAVCPDPLEGVDSRPGAA